MLALRLVRRVVRVRPRCLLDELLPGGAKILRKGETGRVLRAEGGRQRVVLRRVPSGRSRLTRALGVRSVSVPRAESLC